jgi:hypothetical protein
MHLNAEIAIGILFDFCLLFSSFLIASYSAGALVCALTASHQLRKSLSFVLSRVFSVGILILTSAAAAADDASRFK